MFIPKNSQIAKGLTLIERLGLPEQWFPTREEFVTVTEFEKRAWEMSELNLSYNEILATVNLLHALLIFRNSGMPLFVFRPNLIKLLCETSVFDGSLALLHLPFEGICIEVPQKTFAPPIEDTQQIFITQCLGDRLRIVLCSHEQTHFITLAETGTTIREAVEATKRMCEQQLLPKEFAEALERSRAYEDYYNTDIFNFSINSILYISSHDADIVEDKSLVWKYHQQLQGLKQKNKRTMLEAKLRDAKKHKIYICGSKIELPREYFAPLTEKARQLTVRFRVRGHWRHQVCGVKFSERKLIWIQPYWKGPTYAEMLARNYIVRK